MEMELLALNAELASIAASGQQLKKPIKIPRPKHVRKPNSGVRHADSVPGGTAPDAYKRGVSVLAATTRGGVRRS